MNKPFDIKNFLSRHLIIFKIGAITGSIIILFDVINLLVIYRYVKLDYYLSVVAIFFLMAGIIINRRFREVEIIKQKPVNLLTIREMEIFRHIADGKTNKEIATMHFIEVSTVKTHINNIYSKLSVSNRKEARTKYTEMVDKRPLI